MAIDLTRFESDIMSVFSGHFDEIELKFNETPLESGDGPICQLRVKKGVARYAYMFYLENIESMQTTGYTINNLEALREKALYNLIPGDKEESYQPVVIIGDSLIKSFNRKSND